MAHCKIEGTFKDDSYHALEVAKSMGACGICSYSVDKLDTFRHLPAEEGSITFEMFDDEATFKQLHKIAKLICNLTYDYIVSIREFEGGE